MIIFWGGLVLVGVSDQFGRAPHPHIEPTQVASVGLRVIKQLTRTGSTNDYVKGRIKRRVRACGHVWDSKKHLPSGKSSHTNHRQDGTLKKHTPCIPIHYQVFVSEKGSVTRSPSSAVLPTLLGEGSPTAIDQAENKW